MKSKKALTVILLVFVGCSLGYLIVKESGVNTVVERPAEEALAAVEEVPVAAEPPEDKAQQEAERKIVAYYFHGNVRCMTCRKLEAFSREAINTGFAQELQQGRLEWRIVNVDEPTNRHFIEDYQLHTRSLVLVDMHNGKQTRWKNLDKIWQLVRNKQGFFQYVQSEINEYLGTN